MDAFKTRKEIVRVNTFWWNFQEKFIFIYHVHLFDKNPSGLHISLNTRPEPLAYMNDDIPVKFGHYIWDHGLEGGQGVMRPFINLSLNFAPHQITKGLQSFELGGQISLDQGSFRLAFSQPGWFWLCFGWPGHKIHCLCEEKDIF